LVPQADDRQTFWENVLKGVYAITEIPADRWDADLYYDPDPAARDKIYSRWGGFLNDVLFDPLEFGMPPNSLRSIDPMQLLALKVAKAALADAGYANRPFERGRTSVILGASGGTGDLGAKYLLRSSLPLLFGEQAAGLVEQAGDRLPEWTEDSFAGLLLNVAAGRIANRLDLGGLNFVVDAACASSLTAVHLAVRELETQGSDLVIVGGVDTVQNPFGYLCFSKTQALSATGQPRTFDAEADGIAISEGIVMLVLKRLADAERDGDRIYAVIQGSNGSSDGKAKGLTAPRPEGQVLALERAYQKAGIDPTTVGLFEAHGTGTAVGDRTEAVSLGTFLEEAGAQPNSHAVGSVKSMIGHTKASAGVAGLAKVALALYHKVLPPTLGVTTPNPQARFGSGPLYVNSETRPWLHSQAHPRRAGVSAFGFGGTNFHVVVEEYQGDYNGRPAVSQEWESELLLLSGRDRAEIDQTLRQLSQALRQGAQPRLRDLAYTLWQSYRPEAAVHLAIVAESLADLQGKLEAWLGGEKAAGVYETLTLTPGPSPWESEGGMTLTPALPLSGGGRKEGGVAFLFPGQGSQYPNMLRDLTLHFAEVREAFEMGERTLAGHYERPFGQYIFPPPAFDPETRQRQEAELTATHVAQPALGLASLGALQLLESLGLRPEMVAGHSYGEYVALLAAGAIHTQTLITLSEARGRAMLAVGDELGTMAAAGADAARVQSVLGHLADVWIANLNGPEQTILAGTKEGVALAIALLNEAGIRTRPLNVAAAFHSPIVAQAQAHFAEALQAATYARPQLRLYANTTAALYPDEPEAIRALLVEHLARPVRFMEQIEAMYADGARVFVEVGPRNFLTNLVRQILGQRPHLAVAMDNPGRPGLTQLHHALAQLAVAGLPINLARLYQGRSVRLLNLERLVEETRPAPLSATTWLVNGSSARPHREPPKRYEPLSLPSAHHRDAEIAERTPEEAPRPPHLSGEPQEIQNPKSKIQNEAAPAMLQFQALMGQFLETQRNVMLAYLQGERIHGRGAESAEGVKEETSLQLSHPLPNPPPTRGRERPSPLQGEGSGERVGSSEPPRPPRLSGEAEAIQNPKSKIQNPAALTQLLLEVVSDRTGYPAEALRLDVDVEADLGIDSIKRVEVLGVFLKQALAGRPQLEQQAMSELSGVKTL
ncbi:MAG: beta-ketoacyl synthase N-terminal-like domain-containing protein, partial [Chloroflexota bacterium]